MVGKRRAASGGDLKHWRSKEVRLLLMQKRVARAMAIQMDPEFRFELSLADAYAIGLPLGAERDRVKLWVMNAEILPEPGNQQRGRQDLVRLLPYADKPLLWLLECVLMLHAVRSAPDLLPRSHQHELLMSPLHDLEELAVHKQLLLVVVNLPSPHEDETRQVRAGGSRAPLPQPLLHLLLFAHVHQHHIRLVQEQPRVVEGKGRRLFASIDDEFQRDRGHVRVIVVYVQRLSIDFEVRLKECFGLGERAHQTASEEEIHGILDVLREFTRGRFLCPCCP